MSNTCFLAGKVKVLNIVLSGDQDILAFVEFDDHGYKNHFVLRLLEAQNGYDEIVHLDQIGTDLTKFSFESKSSFPIIEKYRSLVEGYKNVKEFKKLFTEVANAVVVN